MQRNWIAAFMLCLGLGASPAVWADGVMLNGLSPRSLSRGGTNLGHADNGAILHDNPAAMVNMAGNGMFDVGAVGLISSFRYSDPFATDTHTSMSGLPQISYMQKSADGVWAYGIGFFTPAGFCETFDLNRPFPAGVQHYKSYAALAKVLPGVSCRLTERLAVGGTLGVGICYANLEGPYVLQGPDIVGLPIHLDTHDTGAALVWSTGLQYDLTDTTTLGATYISQSNFELHGNTSISSPFLPGAAAYDSVLGMTWPDSLGVGVRQEVGERTALSCDLLYVGWSRAFDQFTMKLRNPTNPLFPEIQENLPLHWRDSLSVRLGLERQLEIGGTFRCGYVNHPNPVPASTLTPYIQATLQHAFSVGYGWGWNDWEIDAGYMYLFGPTQHVGMSGLVGGDFNNSSHDAQIHAMFLSFIKPF